MLVQRGSHVLEVGVVAAEAIGAAQSNNSGHAARSLRSRPYAGDLSERSRG